MGRDRIWRDVIGSCRRCGDIFGYYGDMIGWNGDMIGDCGEMMGCCGDMAVHMLRWEGRRRGKIMFLDGEGT